MKEKEICEKHGFLWFKRTPFSVFACKPGIVAALDSDGSFSVTHVGDNCGTEQGHLVWISRFQCLGTTMGKKIPGIIEDMLHICEYEVIDDYSTCFASTYGDSEACVHTRYGMCEIMHRGTNYSQFPFWKTGKYAWPIVPFGVKFKALTKCFINCGYVPIYDFMLYSQKKFNKKK